MRITGQGWCALHGQCPWIHIFALLPKHIVHLRTPETFRAFHLLPAIDYIITTPFSPNKYFLLGLFVRVYI